MCQQISAHVDGGTSDTIKPKQKGARTPNFVIIVENMHCSSIGARKNSNRHNVFLVNGVLNDALYIKWDDIDFQIYDESKCFDKMCYEEPPMMYIKHESQVITNSNKNQGT